MNTMKVKPGQPGITDPSQALGAATRRNKTGRIKKLRKGKAVMR